VPVLPKRETPDSGQPGSSTVALPRPSAKACFFHPIIGLFLSLSLSVSVLKHSACFAQELLSDTKKYLFMDVISPF